MSHIAPGAAPGHQAAISSTAPAGDELAGGFFSEVHHG